MPAHSPSLLSSIYDAIEERIPPHRYDFYATVVVAHIIAVFVLFLTPMIPTTSFFGTVACATAVYTYIWLELFGHLFGSGLSIVMARTAASESTIALATKLRTARSVTTPQSPRAFGQAVIDDVIRPTARSAAHSTKSLIRSARSLLSTARSSSPIASVATAASPSLLTARVPEPISVRNELLYAISPLLGIPDLSQPLRTAREEDSLSAFVRPRSESSHDRFAQHSDREQQRSSDSHGEEDGPQSEDDTKTEDIPSLVHRESPVSSPTRHSGAEPRGRSITDVSPTVRSERPEDDGPANKKRKSGPVSVNITVNAHRLD